jgi:hypothetical protein
MSLEQEFNSINKAEIKETSSYESKPGRYLCRVTGVELSPKDHKGTPYFLMKMRSQNDKEINTKLWRANPNDEASKKANKEKKIKRFFTDAGVDLTITRGEAVLKDIVGRSLMCMFTSEEYIGVERNNNNKPCKRTSISLYYTGPQDEDMKPIGDDKAYKVLSAEDEEKLSQQLGVWEMNNASQVAAVEKQKASAKTPVGNTPAPQASATQDEEDDLPF